MRVFRGIVVLFLLAASVVGNTLAPVAPPAKQDSLRLRWRSAAIRIAISSSVTQPNPNIQTGSDVHGAIRRSVEAWQNAGDIELQFEPSERRNVSPAGGSGDGVSLITIASSAENVLLFSKDPLGEAARTRVFYNRLGFITEADIVLNPYQLFSTDGTLGTFDLESTITHEIGHLLGLRHSGVLGSTMSESFSKNGLFGLVDISARSLAASDIAAVRELYGASSDKSCCGAITGKLTLQSGRAASNVRVWAEESETGIVAAQGVTSADGTFRLGGLRSGEYSMFWQKRNAESGSFGQLGIARVEKGLNSTINEKILSRRSGLVVDYAGVNGQLSESAVAVRRGEEYTLYLGGKGLDVDLISISVRSPFVAIDPTSITTQDFGDRIEAVSVVIKIAEDAPRGTYSVFVTRSDGSQAALIGALDIQ